MQYPNQKSVELQYETKEDPLLMTLVYLLSAVFVTLVIMVAYFMEVAVVKEIVDFFAPTFKKLYYKLILILFSPPEKNGNRK